MQLLNRFSAVLTLTLSATLLSCQQQHSFVPHTEASATALRELIASAPFQTIDLDGLETEYLYPDLIIGSVDPDEDEIFLGGSFGALLMDDSLYIADHIQNSILVAHKNDTHFSRQFGRVGEGPGEFRGIRALYRSDEYIFVVDAIVRKLMVFDLDFQFQRLLQAGTQSWYGYDATTSRLITTAEKGNMNRIIVRSATPPFDSIGAVLPRLTPEDDPAKFYNEPVLVASENGVLIASYWGLPYLFVYDDSLQLRLTIELTGADVDPLKIKEAGGFGTIKIRSFQLAVEMTDTGTYYFATPSSVYVIASEEGRYHLAEKYALRRSRDLAPDAKENRIATFDLTSTKKHFSIQ